MGDIHCPQLTSHIFSILELKKAKEYYGFVHSPAFQKQQPESAVTQNTTQREWCCIALPKRIVSDLVAYKACPLQTLWKDALVLPSFESNAKRANVLSAWTPLYRCDYMLSFRSI
ncbi:unnamed protein product [Penicillium camemberti]|uniref:Str. FM013 n=1 Tax=Penicillium camemberti (strain FM 013) TaxID=1429867 RepID=A0A0G4PSQ4_PENC3|nr:unnamed protein product [Penicillium camemberti]